jgi:hypothetical protein
MIKAMMVLLVLLFAAPALAQEEPLPAPPPDAPVPPPPPPAPPAQPQPAPVYPAQPVPPGYQQPGYPPPGYQQPGYPPPGYGYPPPYVRLETNRTAQRVAIYAELLGKTILWGVGCDVNITSWLGLGASFSYYKISDWQLGLVAPYVNFYPVGNQKHALLVQVGPEIAFGATGSQWIWEDSGTYVFGQASLGYEYRNGFLVRPALSFFFNQHGFIPWFGVSLGGAF